MEVRSYQQSANLIFSFFPAADDIRVRGRVRFARREVTLSLPHNFSLTSCHPDIVGLASLLLGYPFIKREIDNQLPVSMEFAETVSKRLGKVFKRVDGTLKPRRDRTRGESRPALAYSGGADCTAAMQLMPESTHMVYLKRQIPEELDGWRGYCSRDAAFDNETATEAAEVLRRVGRDCSIVATDLEYLRHPVGFPTDLACGVPAIVLADHHNFDSIGWGTVLESAYGVGRGPFIDYAENYARWRAVFDVVGLPFFNPVAGVSEIGTMKALRKRECRPMNFKQSESLPG